METVSNRRLPVWEEVSTAEQAVPWIWKAKRSILSKRRLSRRGRWVTTENYRPKGQMARRRFGFGGVLRDGRDGLPAESRPLA